MKRGLKIINELKLNVDETTPVDPFAGYVTLMISMLREPFMSSDLKYIIIQNSYSYLREAGYSNEQIEIYNERVKKIVAENIQINSFMG
jgi:predicted SPOUT superfamily RNA methylase MTH1